jgi:hypothetical protein
VSIHAASHDMIGTPQDRAESTGSLTHGNLDLGQEAPPTFAKLVIAAWSSSHPRATR